MELPAHTRLVLAGGSALGAYQAGAYEALHERGRLPDWIAGASIGALNGAVIAGNAQERRVERLREVWRLAAQGGKGNPSTEAPVAQDSRFRKSLSAAVTMVVGRPGLFHRRAPWPFQRSAGMEAALFDTAPMIDTINSNVDFARLNAGTPRFFAVALDAETGEDIVFDTAMQPLQADHLRAAAAFPGFFPAIPIEGRMLVDGGLSANLPLEPVLGIPPEQDTLCVAVDLFAPRGPRPESASDAFKRGLDLVLAVQSRKAIERLQLEYGRRASMQRQGAVSAGGAVTLLHLAYAEDGTESAAKLIDFSAASIRRRWSSGRRDMRAALDALSAAPEPQERGGLRAFRFAAGALVPYL